MKRHRLLRDRVTDIAAEANAYLKRRRQERKPFARLYYPGGQSAAEAAESEPGRALFLAASHAIEAAGPPRTRRQRRAAAQSEK